MENDQVKVPLQVLHIEKRKIIPGGLNRHITREQWEENEGVITKAVWVPANADPSRTEGNVELVSREHTEPDGRRWTLSLQQAVNQRLQEAGIKPKANQNTCLEVIFSGSSMRMNAMGREELLSWATDTLLWAKETWGVKNVVSASLHVDEKTPHIHMILVPIVTGQSRRTASRKKKEAAEGKESRTNQINNNKERLSANDVFTLGKLYAYHDSYYEQVSRKYGINRGVRAERGCHKNHDDSIEYNRNLERQEEELKAQIAEFQADYEDTAEMATAAKAKAMELQEAISKNEAIIRGQQAVIDEENRKLYELKAEQRKTAEKVKELEKAKKEKEDKVEATEAKVSELQEEISKNESVLSGQLTIIDEGKRKLDELKVERARAAKQVDELGTTIKNLEHNSRDLAVTIFKQEDTIEVNNKTLCKLIQEIDNKKKDIKSLGSRGLMELIKEIPELIKKDIQEIVSKYWRGEVTSFKEIRGRVSGQEEELVEIRLRDGQFEYFIEVSKNTGHVWYNGDEGTATWGNGETMYMTELVQYFKEELTDEAREFVHSLYRKKPSEAEATTVVRKPGGMRM